GIPLFSAQSTRASIGGGYPYFGGRFHSRKTTELLKNADTTGSSPVVCDTVAKRSSRSCESRRVFSRVLRLALTVSSSRTRADKAKRSSAIRSIAMSIPFFIVV